MEVPFYLTTQTNRKKSYYNKYVSITGEGILGLSEILSPVVLVVKRGNLGDYCAVFKVSV